QFLRVLAVGGTVAGMGMLFPSTGARAAEEDTEALLLSCMDYRLTDQTTRYMSGRGLRDKYDHIILAGAALGALTRRSGTTSPSPVISTRSKESSCSITVTAARTRSSSAKTW